MSAEKESIIERILVPVDGSPSADHAVRHVAGRVKSGLDAEVHLLHVRPPIAHDVADITKAGLVERLGVDASDHTILPAQRVLGDVGVRCHMRTAMGDPAQEIALYADVHDCSEIVMGTRGMGPIKNMLLGSVANKVLHLVKMPVTLVK